MIDYQNKVRAVVTVYHCVRHRVIHCMGIKEPRPSTMHRTDNAVQPINGPAYIIIIHVVILIILMSLTHLAW